MRRRKIAGAAALLLLFLFGMTSDQKAWSLSTTILFSAAICVALLVTFYKRKSTKEKKWDFDPKRGLTFFGIGLVAFPVMVAARASGSTEIEWQTVALFTVSMSTLAGVIGTFTENIGI